MRIDYVLKIFALSIAFFYITGMTWAGDLLIDTASPLVAVEKRISEGNASWEVYTNRNNIKSLLLSDDKETLWVGTSGGLEERNAHSGELKKIYTNHDGLPDNWAISLLSDGNEGIWVGTYSGLARLMQDGTFQVYDESNSELPDNAVKSLLLDGNGDIWIGTSGGLAHLMQDGTFQVYDESNSELPDNAVEFLLLDGNGGIWVGTTYGGLAHLMQDGTFQVYNESNSGLPDNNVNSLLLDGNGGIWVGTSYGGLVHLSHDGTFQVYDESNSELPDNWINFLLLDDNGGIWIGTIGGLAYLSKNGTFHVYDKFNSDLTDKNVLFLLLDGNGGIWVGTYGDGLVHLSHDGTFQVYDESNSELPDNTVTLLLLDGNGGIWIGTTGGLAHLMQDATFQLYNRSNCDLPGNNVNSLLSDGNGGIWGGTNGGLTHLSHDGTFQVYDKSNSDLPEQWINVLLSDGNGGIWVGTPVGLAHLSQDGTLQVYIMSNSNLLPAANFVNSLLLDGNGGIWIGTGSQLYQGGGLFHLMENGTSHVYDKSNSDLPYSGAQSLLSDENGGIWAGTVRGLFHLMENGTFQVYDTSNSDLPDNEILSLLSDGNGGIWIGTGGGIANMMQDTTFQVYDTSNSDLPNNRVASLLLDGNGRIWIGTGGGGIANMMQDTTFQVYDESNSDLPGNSVKSLLLDGQGGIWVGTGNGGLAHLLLIGQPEQISLPDSPDVKITWFLKRCPFDFRKVHYIELQRSLSKTGVYETVYDASGNPVRFNADYTECPNPWADDCWPTVEGHTPAVKGEGDTQINGYTLNTSITDSEWLEGLPRYYRLAAVIEDDDARLVTMAENREATLMAPAVEENPRVGVALDRSAIAVSPGTEKELSLFLSSLDLFSGEVTLAMESDSPDDVDIKLDSASISLNPGETKSLNLKLQVHPNLLDSEANIRLIAKAANQDTDKSALIKVHAGTGPMVALSIADSRTRPRVMEGITVSGNIIPALAEEEVVISGNDIDSLVLTTNEKGNFEGSFIPTKAGWLTLTAEYGGATSNSAKLFILPTKTHVALSSNVNQATAQGDTLKIEGIITPIRPYETKIHLDIRYLDPADPEAGLKPQFVGDVAINQNGAFYRDIVVPGDGFIHVTASLSETSDFLGINTKLVIPIGQPVGEGIIVVSESGTPEFQDISKSLGTYVYNTLQTRNIPRERIRYLGLSDDGIEADGYADKNNIHHALTDWAVSLISTDDPYKTPLNLYLIGEIEDGHFRLNENETLSAAELDQYLDEAEALVYSNSDSDIKDIKGLPITIVLEGSQSEEWIKTIAGKGRIILTSSSAAPIDQGGFAGYDNLGESSFSRYFYQFINYGSDIEGSFAEANYEILKFYRHTQRPVMDADGDGVGTTKYDRYEASGKFIEYRPSGNLRPKIRTTHPDMTITGRGNNTLWAIATDPEQEMKGVFCSITDSSNRTKHIELTPVETQENWYETQMETFSQTGCHQVVYYAKDSAGNVSLPVERFLHVTASALHSNSDPDDPVDEPAAIPQVPTLTLTMEGSRVSISWTAVPDADGYTLLYAPYPDAVIIGQFDMGNQTGIPTFEAAGMAFYVAVQAYNSKGESGLSNIDWFDLR